MREEDIGVLNDFIANKISKVNQKKKKLNHFSILKAQLKTDVHLLGNGFII